MYYIGLDVHSKQSTFCVLDDNGKRIRTFTRKGHWRGVIEALNQYQPFAICFEASLGYEPLYRSLLKIAKRVEVAHPGKIRLIFRSKRKNDRIDAEKLAKLLYLGEVPAVYVPRTEVMGWRRMICFRENTVRKRTQLKNQLRALLRSLGIEAVRSLWSRAGIRWLQDLELPPGYDMQRNYLLSQYLMVVQQLKEVEKRLNAQGRRHPMVKLLQTIPGVGPRTAEAVVAWIDEIRRFRRGKALACYFGLVPRQDASGGKNRLGHITKDGPALVRRLLTEANWQGVRRSPTIRRKYEQYQQGKQERRKIALVATANYLVRVMHQMLQTGTVWQEHESASQEESDT